MYMQARYYDPVIGRFYSNDPVDAVSHLSNAEGIQGFNRYSYAINNPFKYTDPDGEKVEVIARPLRSPIGGGAGAHTYTRITSSDGSVTTFSSTKIDGKNVVKQDLKADNTLHMDFGKSTIAVPEGMTQDQFDQAAIATGTEMVNSESLDYALFPSDSNEGNCHTTTRNLINGAGGEINENFNPKSFNPDLHGDRETNVDQ
jgi:RHS repeat-associated protein